MNSDDFSIEIIKSKLHKNNLDLKECNPETNCAAVLIPIIKIADDWNILFTQRSDKVASHKNEVSFPGGSYDTIDLTLEATALREVFEEIGVKSNRITIIGTLPFSTTITGFRVFPFVGIIDSLVDLKINIDEVKSVFTIPIRWLMDDDNFYEADYSTPEFGTRKVIHYQEYQGEHLWGYTAKVTRQFLEILK